MDNTFEPFSFNQRLIIGFCILKAECGKDSFLGDEFINIHAIKCLSDENIYSKLTSIACLE